MDAMEIIAPFRYITKWTLLNTFISKLILWQFVMIMAILIKIQRFITFSPHRVQPQLLHYLLQHHL